MQGQKNNGPTRTIRVIYFDPDATDSSSDEEEQQGNNTPKLFVNVITIPAGTGDSGDIKPEESHGPVSTLRPYTGGQQRYGNNRSVWLVKNEAPSPTAVNRLKEFESGKMPSPVKKTSDRVHPAPAAKEETEAGVVFEERQAAGVLTLSKQEEFGWDSGEFSNGVELGSEIGMCKGLNFDTDLYLNEEELGWMEEYLCREQRHTCDEATDVLRGCL